MEPDSIIKALNAAFKEEFRKRIIAYMKPEIDRIVDELIAAYPSQVKAFRDHATDQFLAGIVITAKRQEPK